MVKRKHKSGIDLDCGFCRILDKVWIVAAVITTPIMGFFATLSGMNIVGVLVWLGLAVIIYVPTGYYINKHVLRNMPTMHSYFTEVDV